MKPFHIDVDTKNRTHIEEPILTQYDSAVFVLKITDDGEPYDYTNVTSFTLTSYRPDFESVFSIGDQTGEEITFDVSGSHLAVPGRVKASIQMYYSDGRSSTLYFTYQVDPDLTANYKPSEKERSLIELVLVEGPAVIQEAKDVTAEAKEQLLILEEKMKEDWTGPEGPQGPEGLTGPEGPQGLTGPEGPEGPQGLTGPEGPEGPEGPQGVEGPEGPQGLTGPEGPQGEMGPEGPKGDNFTVDATGLLSTRDAYDLEPEGFSFLSTDTGELYIRQGATGWSNGIPFGRGEQGPIGATGPEGPEGPQGPEGPAGADGVNGEDGLQGPQGEIGPEGPQGPEGPKGDSSTKMYDYEVVATEDNQTNFTIPLSTFDKVTDSLIVVQNTATLNPFRQYSVEGLNLILTEGVTSGTTLYLHISKNVLTNNVDVVSGSIIATNTLPMDRVIGLQEALANSGGSAEMAAQINDLYKMSTSIMREQAHTKLLQDAADRLDGGTIFAHDMDGNLIGMTLDEANSQNIVIRDGKMMLIEKSEVTQTRTDITVVSTAQDTSGNGGRKITMLSDGRLVAVTKEGISVKVHSSLDGENWQYHHGLSPAVGASIIDCAIASKGLYIYLLFTWNVTASFVRLDFLNNIKHSIQQVDSNQTSMSNCSITINPEGTELNASWSSKNTANSNNWGIRYAKGVISQMDGSVTLGTVEQITTYAGYDFMNSSIVCDGSSVYIFAQRMSATVNSIMVFKNDRTLSLDNGTFFNVLWSYGTLYNGGTYTQSSPSAIFVPKSVNGYPFGRIWVAWHGRDATLSTYFNIRIAYSDDCGVTWSVMQRLTDSNVPTIGNAMMPSITANKNNEISVVYEETGSAPTVSKIINVGGTWGTNQLIRTNSLNHPYPSVLFDSTFSIDFTSPLLIFTDTGKVGFYGTWKEPVETPTLTASVVYDLPTTDYAGLFVDFIGDLNVKAYLDGNEMDASEGFNENELQFTKTVTPWDGIPTQLRLDLSRTSITGGESDAITTVLGGIS